MYKIAILILILLPMSKTAWAHDPIFGSGPHVLFKSGVETALDLGFKQDQSGSNTSPSLLLTYGLTGDWAAGVALPYSISSGQKSSKVNAFTKYRFWRQDKLGLQQSAAVSFKIISSDTTDSIVGLSYGYEGRTWYRWVSLRYRNNGTSLDFYRGNKLLIDVVGGIRPHQTSYTEPDTVWLIELNGEVSKPSSLSGTDVLNSGGNQWFLSPGLFWTTHNFAIKSGVQIPILNKLNGNQAQDKYRAKLVLEWHL